MSTFCPGTELKSWITSIPRSFKDPTTWGLWISGPSEYILSLFARAFSASSSALRTPKQNPAVRARMISFVIILPLSYIFFGNYA
jgi:hypothetical protein